jgi:hypothetical protein
MMMAGGAFQSIQRRGKMCEFCIQHGEGKQWYLQMKNYSNELLLTPLTHDQIEAVGFNTRYDWLDNFVKWFIVPAYRGKFPEESQSNDGTSTSEKPASPPSEEQILAQSKIEHFGQVIHIEDVEKLFTMADSITRMPCNCRYFIPDLPTKGIVLG